MATDKQCLSLDACSTTSQEVRVMSAGLSSFKSIVLHDM